jgi:hypothetical protein
MHRSQRSPSVRSFPSCSSFRGRLLRGALLRAALAASLVAAAAPIAASDTTVPGFRLDRIANPAASSVTCTLPGGDFFAFDGVSCDRYQSDGTFVFHLGDLPAFGYPSFAEATPDGLAVIVGESGTVFSPPDGRLWRVPLDGSGPTLVATVPQNFDGAFLPNGKLIVSATLNGAFAGNDFVLVDVPATTATPIGHVDGFSGPVAVSRTGDVYYGTVAGQIPAPPGSTDILRWGYAAILGGAWLDSNNASVAATGFDGASSLAFDPLRGRLYLAENGGVPYLHRIRRVKSTGAASPTVADGDHWISSIRFQDLGGGATFDPYQPSDGLSLVYQTSDFSGMDDLVTLAPQAPSIVASGPGLSGVGEITLSLSGAVPGGAALLTICPQTSLLPVETFYALPKFRLHTTFVLSETTRLPFLIPTDAAGNGSMVIWNSGSLNGLFGYQFHVGLPNGALIGASNVTLF